MSTARQLSKFLLIPLSKIYGLGTGMRNKLYDWGVFKEHEFDIPVISVGNLAVGGTGKTPHTEYIVHLLRDRFTIGVLSRGYRRKTKGFVLATPHSTPRQIGDEPYQMYHKFGRRVMVAVCENRVEGIAKMREINPDLNLIILDDAFQHRRVRPAVSILLTEFNRPFYNDRLMPYGRLRESAKNVSRADIVIVTKLPNKVKAIDYRLCQKNLNLIPDQDLFFTRYSYGSLRPVFAGNVVSSRIPDLEELGHDSVLLAVCGIGNPRPFVRYVKSFDTKVKVNVFPDHHDYTRKDMETLLARFQTMPPGKRYIITTEKDAVRMINNPYFPHALKPYIFYVPIQVEFDEINGNNLLITILKHLKTKKF